LPRENTDDDERLWRARRAPRDHGQAASDESAIFPKVSAPQPVADDERHGGSPVIERIERSANRRMDAEQLKEVRRHERATQSLDAVAERKIERRLEVLWRRSDHGHVVKDILR